MLENHYETQIALLDRFRNSNLQLAIKIDLSKQSSLFKKELRIRGVYLYGRAFVEESTRLSEIELDVILYNEIDLKSITPPEGFTLFRIRDLQEFPYCAAVRVPPPDSS